MKIIVLGHARHGKDTVCNILRSAYGLSFVSSSYFVAEKAVRPYLANMGIIYPDFDTCYADRVNHRSKWFDAISEYNKDDAARLGRELFKEHDIYCGIRNIREFKALKAERAFFCAFWVDRSEIEPEEAQSSNTIGRENADYIINNNGSLEELEQEVRKAYKITEYHYQQSLK